MEAKINIIERIKSKLKATYVFVQLDESRTVIHFEFKDKQMLTLGEENELLKLIAEKIQPKKVFVCCNRQYKEKNLPWSAFLHLEGISLVDSFTELIIKGFNARK